MQKKYIFPLFYAAILFLVIRIANDVPNGLWYFEHNQAFVFTEVVGVVINCYLGSWLVRRWLMWCMVHRYPLLVEYGCVVIVIVVMFFSVVFMSHGLGVFHELRSMLIPVQVTILMSIGLYLFVKFAYIERLYHEQLLNNERILNNQLKTEMSLLRTQFHPHFLFNMLNTIYFSIDENNNKARTTVEHLSNLLRCQLYQGEEKITIEREISALISYVELVRIRFGDKLKMSVDIDPQLGNQLVHPHIFMPLIENAFKHCGGEYIIDIKMTSIKGGITLEVSNSVAPVEKDDAIKSNTGGLGLRNLRKRLSLLYPGNQHCLELSTTETTFSVMLLLRLDS